ncbi:hypothetical protein GPECTOR_6g789 [Gonium pectorale]|uniref:RAP domain-containing protein n=1 Tax=Gonium pectorale TaxID=33097 RepID=A0A150GVK8_GONPE|nr:hypothetical protein GPECTOR_6g789 [Gonium pectorale]|eukprot:KXZ53871.1 hypothetical protein GPECTOR_6g789 [Gonium pectorale]
MMRRAALQLLFRLSDGASQPQPGQLTQLQSLILALTGHSSATAAASFRVADGLRALSGTPLQDPLATDIADPQLSHWQGRRLEPWTGQDGALEEGLPGEELAEAPEAREAPAFPLPGTAPDAATQRRTLQLLDGLLAPHLQGRYGESFNPAQLTKMMWVGTRTGTWGRVQTAAVQRLAAVVHPNMPYSTDDYWAPLSLWVLARAAVAARPAARGSGGGGVSEGAVTAAALTAEARRRLLPSLLQLVERKAECIQSQGLSLLFWSLGQLRIRDTRLLAALGRRAYDLVPELPPQGLANILHGCAVLELSRRDQAAVQAKAPFLQRLVREAASRGMSTFTAAEMGQVAWAATKLGLQCRPLLAAVCDHIVTCDLDEQASPSQVWANVMYSMALSDHYDPRVIDRLALAVAPPPRGREFFGASAGPAAAWLTAADGSRGDRAHEPQCGNDSSPVEASPPRVMGLRASAAATVAPAAGSIGGRGGSAVAADAAAQPPPPPPQPRISNAAAAFTARPPRPPAPGPPPLGAFNPAVRSATPQSCCNILFALGTLRHLDERIFDVLIGRMAAHGSACSVADVSLALRACAHVNYWPPYLDELLAQALPRLQAEAPRVMAHNLLWSLTVLGMLADPALQPLVRLLVQIVNTYGTSNWRLTAAPPQLQLQQEESLAVEPSLLPASVAALAEADAPEATAAPAAQASAGAELDPLGGRDSRKKLLSFMNASRGEQRQMRNAGSAGANLSAAMEDQSQLVQYHWESRVLGLTGPDYDLAPAGVAWGSVLESVRAHRLLVAAAQRPMYVQQRVMELVKEMAESDAFPSIVAVEQEVLLEPELMSVDIIVHMAHPDADRATATAAEAATGSGGEGDGGAARRGGQEEQEDTDEGAEVVYVYSAPSVALGPAAAAVAGGRSVPPPLAPTRLLSNPPSTRRAPSQPATPSSAPDSSPPPQHQRPDNLRPPPPPGTYQVAIEVDGPWHQMRNRPLHRDASTSFRDRLLARKLGGPQNVLVVRTDVWVEQMTGDEERRRALWRALRHTVPPRRAAPWSTAAAAPAKTAEGVPVEAAGAAPASAYAEEGAEDPADGRDQGSPAYADPVVATCF